MFKITYLRACYLYGIEAKGLYFRDLKGNFIQLINLGDADYVRTLTERGFTFYQLRAGDAKDE